MAAKDINSLFELQCRLVSEPKLPFAEFLTLISSCVHDGDRISRTIFTKLLDGFRSISPEELEALFCILEIGASTKLRENADAALSYFVAAQECLTRINAAAITKRAA